MEQLPEDSLEPAAVEGGGAGGFRADDGGERWVFTPAEAAGLLGVRESWLRRKAAARVVPCTFLGKHLRFSRADLEAIVAAGARPVRRGR